MTLVITYHTCLNIYLLCYNLSFVVMAMTFFVNFQFLKQSWICSLEGLFKTTYNKSFIFFCWNFVPGWVGVTMKSTKIESPPIQTIDSQFHLQHTKNSMILSFSC